MELCGKILLGWLMFNVSMIGPSLGVLFARHYGLNEFFWSLVGMPLALSVLLVVSSTTIVRMNQG